MLARSSVAMKTCSRRNPCMGFFNQIRRQQQTSNEHPISLVSCLGVDGYPATQSAETGDEGRSDEEDNAEYYKHHKASPLAEIEVADTRKPITQATDGTAGSADAGVQGVISWREEQMETAEETLMRASRMWREAAMRGDPDSPQGRVLRGLRGEV